MKTIRVRLCFLTLVTLLLCMVCFAEETLISPVDTGAVLYAEETFSLPVDATPGYAPNRALFIENGYEDDSITVIMEKYRENDADYNVARVTIASPTQLRTALAGAYGTKKTNKVSKLAENNRAVVAMNGDYYLNRTGGYVVRQGEVFRKTPTKNKDMLIIDDLGDFHILVNSDPNQLKAILDSDRTIINAFTFGPALVIDGMLQEMPAKYEFNIRGREPRSAIGQLDALTYILLVVDGRSDQNKGVTVAQVADFMSRMGCVQAFNLDGGNTAALVFNGELYCDKSASGERSISDIIYFASAVPPTK